MSEVTAAPAVHSAEAPQSDESMWLTMGLTSVFQQMLKKPEPDDDESAQASSPVTSEVNKTLAHFMAQSVTGFGL